MTHGPVSSAGDEGRPVWGHALGLGSTRGSTGRAGPARRGISQRPAGQLGRAVTSVSGDDEGGWRRLEGAVGSTGPTHEFGSQPHSSRVSASPPAQQGPRPWSQLCPHLLTQGSPSREMTQRWGLGFAASPRPPSPAPSGSQAPSWLRRPLGGGGGGAFVFGAGGSF